MSKNEKYLGFLNGENIGAIPKPDKNSKNNQYLYELCLKKDKEHKMLEELAKETNELKKTVEILKVTNKIDFNMDYESIKNLVASGRAQEVFLIGDQITIPWIDVEANKEYDMPFDIVKFEDVEIESGEIVPGMFLQSHYATPFGIQFSNYQAMYYAEQELAAGKYCFEIGSNWGNNCVAGSVYNFTLTKPVPAGGQIAGIREAPNQVTANWKIYTYADKNTITPLETVNISEGEDGTKLGIINVSGTGELNSLHRVAYGNNRWSQSAIRKWLNSEERKNLWWESQSDYDRPPNELANRAGFLSGFPEGFKNILATVKVTTATNTVTDGGVWDITYDKFFLPSLEEMYINPQIRGEGTYYPYWKEVRGSDTLFQQFQTYPELITYATENHFASQYVRLRSALRGGGSNAWGVYSSGYVNSGHAVNSWRSAPVCVIASSNR